MSNNLPVPFDYENWPDEQKLAWVEERVREIQYVLSLGVKNPAAKKHLERLCWELNRWAEALRSELSVLPAPSGETVIGRDHNEVHADVVKDSVIGDGELTHTEMKIDSVTINISNSNGAEAGVPVNQVERAYLNWLIEHSSRVPLGDLNVRMLDGSVAPDIKLDEVFVHLNVRRTQDALERGDAPDARVPVPVLDVINRTRVLVILGDPGSGKTTLLNFLTTCLAGARLNPHDSSYYLDRLSLPQTSRRPAVNWSHGALLPIRVTLRDFVRDLPKRTQRGTARLLKEHIQAQLVEHGFAELADEVHRALRKGQCLVMFDGLDEIADLKKRHIVRDAINDFTASYPDSRFIVTCRTLSYTDPDWRLDQHRRVVDVTLDRLSGEAIDEFISRWYEALVRRGVRSREAAEEEASDLREAISSLEGLPHNPMLLTVICVVHTYWGKLPRDRARLYNECINLLLWKWTQPRLTPENGWEAGIIDQLGAREDQLVSGLCELAYHMHSEQSRSRRDVDIPHSEVLTILGRHLNNDLQKAARFCDFIEQEAGLLIGKGQPPNGDRTYAFPHRGFQEFLAAVHIVNELDLIYCIADLVRQGDIWHEVLLLAIGHLVLNQHERGRPLAAINALIKRTHPTGPEGWRAVWWAAEMLTIYGRANAESHDHLGRELVPVLMEQLVALVEGGHLSPVERVKAGDALGILGDPRPGVCTREPEMVVIKGGRFRLGEGKEQHTVTLKPFAIARYPVTNAQFAEFWNSGEYERDEYWTSAGRVWRNQAWHLGGYLGDPCLGIPNRPVVGITWYEAIAYVNWLRAKTKKPYRLLTEAEWERAAAGLERRKYPFGNRASNDDVNTRESGVRQTSAVGIFPKDQTPEGVFDMGGNVWEWTSSLYRPYPYRANDGRENIGGAGARCVRGGAYDRDRSEMHCDWRREVDPRACVPLLGFRLAMDVT